MEIDVFARRESLEHLQRRVPSLTDEEADQVAEALGDLPLAVEQAGAWLAETGIPRPTTWRSWPTSQPGCSRQPA